MSVCVPVSPMSADSHERSDSSGSFVRARLRTDSFIGMPEYEDVPRPEPCFAALLQAPYGGCSGSAYLSNAQLSETLEAESYDVTTGITAAATPQVLSLRQAPSSANEHNNSAPLPTSIDSRPAFVQTEQLQTRLPKPPGVFTSSAMPRPHGLAAASGSLPAPGDMRTSGASDYVMAADVQGRRTTVMLRSLPEGLSRAELLALLDSRGLAGKYNFLYMPFDFDSMANLKHAFVNMVTPADVNHIWAVLDGFSDWPRPSSSVCALAWNNKQQGLEDLIERYRNSPVMHRSVADECKPVLLKDGVKVPFPPPTQSIKPPKFRRNKATKQFW